ncbi:hypothetical protein BV22DRAFT_1011364 [Leucogyrophana mollusca]|uniref:Uncharacterized protein n=1 Tax=Leucogyrophana mollusca TaxID=85980 RepID=A0ACB8BJ90_9AGAM|nr:hypothetical protein BV22DRAFT_1011364 [Leucogyrophana mollusca]
MQLTAVVQYVKLRDQYQLHPKCKKPCLSASLAVARRMGKGKKGTGKGEGASFAREIRRNELYLLRHHCLPLGKKAAHHGQYTLLDNEAILHRVRMYLAAQNLGMITPHGLCLHVNNVIAPALGLSGPNSSITERTAITWLKKLGYSCKEVRKGVYFDGHERPDVIEARNKFLETMKRYEPLMCTYDDKTLEPIPPVLQPGEKEHVPIPQDESIFHTNDNRRRQWLRGNQQALKKKGNGRAVHVSDFICETTGRLALSPTQIAEQMKLPVEQRLKSFDARKIIHPGKNHDAWWDLPQLIKQTDNAADIFEYLHPSKVGIFIFDCSSAHEGLAPDALNVNNMNVNPGGKQTHLRDTVIPLSNPPPKPGQPDTRGTPQSMVYPADHLDPNLAGKPKGMRAVLQERHSVWDELMTRRGGKVTGKCQSCQKSQAKKDAERRVAAAEAMGQEELLNDNDVNQAEEVVAPPVDDWCCMYRVLSLQDDFAHEKPMIQHLLERRGHVCLFLPKFHCELNPIEMVWGYAKYREFPACAPSFPVSFLSPGYRNASDGKFTTAKVLVPQCLDMCDTLTIRRFFRKSWRYMDAYRKGLDSRQVAFAVKKYKSHRRVGLPAAIIREMETRTALSDRI